jgi:hypothetical protein
MHHLGRLRSCLRIAFLLISALNRGTRKKLPDAKKQNEKKNNNDGDFLGSGLHG